MATKAKQPDKDAKRKAKKGKGKKVWRLLGTSSALAAGIAASKVLDATWRTATGHKPPTKPENPDIADREALLWAALSGMAIGVAKTYATRRVASYWVRSTGSLPPGMEEKATKADEREVARAK